MNLLLIPADAIETLATGDLRVHIHDPRRLRHLQEVHRARVGQDYRLGVIDGQIGTGTLLSLENQSAEFSLRLDNDPPAPLNLHVLLALPRPRMLARSLENMATLGVKRITLLNTARVEKSFWQSPELKPEKIRHHFELGLEQARDTRMPSLDCAERFKPFVEDALPALLAGRQGLVADPEAQAQCPRGLPVDTPVTLAIGPEGGFIDYEVEQLRNAGMQGIQLGQRILRVETAIVALLSRLY